MKGSKDLQLGMLGLHCLFKTKYPKMQLIQFPKLSAVKQFGGNREHPKF